MTVRTRTRVVLATTVAVLLAAWTAWVWLRPKPTLNPVMALLKAGRIKDAEVQLRTFLRRDPGSTKGQLLLAQLLLFRIDHLDHADFALARDALEHTPGRFIQKTKPSRRRPSWWRENSATVCLDSMRSRPHGKQRMFSTRPRMREDCCLGCMNMRTAVVKDARSPCDFIRSVPSRSRSRGCLSRWSARACTTRRRRK